VVFKCLMRDEKIARLLLPAIIGEEVIKQAQKKTGWLTFTLL
jgi:hypothetical protein